MQLSLHHESISDALREVIQAIGGPKTVGERMFPDMPVDHAASRIRDCLNADRRDRFTPDQVSMSLRLGRPGGWQARTGFSARERRDPDPGPGRPEDEVARLQSDFIEASKALVTMAGKIDQMQARVSLKSVA